MPKTPEPPLSGNDQLNLNKRKSILKGQLTRFESFLNSPDKVIDKIQLDIRLKKIETSFEEFESIQTNLELLDESESDNRDELENRYFQVIAQAKRLLTSTRETNEDLNNQIMNLNLNNDSHSLKLPPIRLPVFAGDSQTWPTFHDTFKRLIHDNLNLKNVEKLHHLKTCLKDVALKIIANLQTTDDNYDIAWNLLVERFDNKRLMVNDHIKAIMNLPKLNKPLPTQLRELTDSIHTHVSALEKLGLDSISWEWVLICIISSKLDHITNLAWEETLEPGVMPTYENIKKFLTKRCFSLENSSYHNYSQGAHKTPNLSKNSLNNNLNNRSLTSLAVTSNTNVSICPHCKQNHFIYQCSEFSKLSTEQKYNVVKLNKLCTNCLRVGHRNRDCRSSNCKICNKSHNTLLHNNENKVPASANQSLVKFENPNRIVQAQVNSEQGSGNSENVSLNAYFENIDINRQVLLSTAVILMQDCFGYFHECNAILDSGSQSNLITESLCKKLDLKMTPFSIPIGGISQKVTHIKNKTYAKLKSRFNDFQANLSFLVLPVITTNLPVNTFSKETLNYPQDLRLADDKFNIPKQIDVLLGAEIFYELLETNRIYLGKRKPVLFETKLGWIFTGTVDINYSNSQKFKNQSLCHLNQELLNNTLDESLTKFWEIEELPKTKYLSQEQSFAESYYRETTQRDVTGRFIVRLPLAETITDFGDSYSVAVKRLRSIQRKCEQNSDFKRDYFDFLKEYEELGHMSIIPKLEIKKFVEQPSYILPHHAVFKQSSTTTKCRVVFDASSRTNLNVSLNDALSIGYTVQDDLFSIVLRLRLRKYVLSADIEKMFRQIWIHPDDRKYQMILWCPEEYSEVNLFTLNTVTYGTASAPFLASRTLHELASLFENTYPRTCAIIKSSFYMDDLLVSLDSIDEVFEVHHEVSKILETAGFHLRKWSSNCSEILDEIQCNRNNDNNLIELRDGKELKTLGLAWNSNTDTLNFSFKLQNNQSVITKRNVLALISKLFDPLGLIGPTIIRAKLFMQHLWRQGLQWDDPLPSDLDEWWKKFVQELIFINDISINRQVLCDKWSNIELHGFSDASERAYGVCIYLVSRDINGVKHSNLLCAKSKVAPQNKCTLPRLELLASFLLARLSSVLRTSLNLEFSKVRYYSDSTIVLSWLQIDPSRLKTFVANRVAKIIELTDIKDWKHISSKLNAADVISRGVTPNELHKNKMWWHGPKFLINTSRDDSDQTEFISLSNEDLPEIKQSVISLPSTRVIDFNLFNKFSSFTKLLHVTAYCLRFKTIVLKKNNYESLSLNPDELEYSLKCLIRLAQSEVFTEEFQFLKKKKPLKHSSKILCLNPFLDHDNILRVGGRLKNSHLEYNQKHPMILPKGHSLTHLIIMHEHIKNLHAGCQNLLATLRLQYWPIDGKSVVKKVIRGCVKCFRVNPRSTQFLMGDLPSARVTPSRPFSRCGLDYCGPVLIKDGTLRSPKVVKAYICVFVCFSVRAVHIELVKDLTTDSFLNCLKRFISRRGKPYEIFSDNGSNFIGAQSHLSELYNFLTDEFHNDRVSQYLSSDEIHWRTIPSRSPHMGGLWESCIKSLKYHLKRILGNASITYEEMYTVLTQIECVLNSRPLSPLSSDPNDYLPLTPGHFLIGEPLVAPPQQDVQDVNPNRLTRYYRIQQLFQHFWNRWSREYLTTLQARSKWKSKSTENPIVGDLVILKEDNSPPLRWPMARIVELHSGKDNIVRVVSVKVSNGNVFKRSLAKICLLPIESKL